MNAAALLICAMALAYASASNMIHTGPVTTPGEILQAIDPLEPEISGDGFAPNAVFEYIPPYITGVELYGSAVRGDASTGQVTTRWHRAFPHFYLLLSGYPVGHGCEIHIEFFTPGSGVSILPIQFDENPASWRLQRISLSAFPGATKVRIVASDSSDKMRSWIGFSPPFTIPKPKATVYPTEVQLQLLLILLCVAACLIGVLGPGIVARAYFPRVQSMVWLPVPGILILAGIGLLAWLGPRNWSPAIISRTGLVILFLFVGISLIRRPLTTLLSTAELQVVGIIALLVVIAVAKSSYSIGPSGELYRGTNSHGLEPGTRSDSRISYHVVHLIGIRESGNSALGANLFGPWSFSHRGPIAGLAAAPLVLSANVTFPAVLPEARWTLFDSQGFTAYRIAMMTLAAGALCIAYGLARLFLRKQWAMLAFLVMAAAPFTMHEIFFTWPKILAGSGALLAAFLALKRRFFAAGLVVGIGYLSHPSVLLCFPAILSLTVIGVKRKSANRKPNFFTYGLPAIAACAGLLVCMAMWREVNHGHFQQDSFFAYFHETIPFKFTPINWLHSRLINLSMTVVPLDAFLYHRFDVEMLPLDGTPQPWAQFMHQYWSTLPFGAGIVFYAALVWLMATAVAKAKYWAWLVIAPPFVLFLVYWGPGNTGLLREGLHGWVLGLLLFSTVIWNRHLAGSRSFWIFATIALAIRGLEMLAMLIPFSAWSRGYVLQRPYQVSDLLMLTVMISGTALLTWFTVSACLSIRPVNTKPESLRPS